MNAFLPFLLFGLGLAGCAPKEKPASPASGESVARSSANGEPSARGPVFALCPKALNNPYFNLVQQGANEEAAKLGIPKPDWVGGTEADAAKQVALINDLISRGVDGIALSPNAPDSVNSVIERAVAKKIPVICFDADAPRSKRIAYVGTDNYAAGVIAGKEMTRALGGKGDVLAVTGGLGAFNLKERLRGFEAGLKGGAVKIASVQACDDDQAKAHRIIEDYLTAHPKLSGIFAVGLWSVLPAGQILEQKKLTGKIRVVGFDTLPEELALVKKGSVQVLVGQKPHEMGAKAIELLNEIHKGGKLSQTIYDTGTDVVTLANVDQFMKK